MIGQKNHDVFSRLLDARLAEGQLSGEMMVGYSYTMRGLVVSMFLLLPALALVWWLDIPSNWAEVAYLGAAIGAICLGGLIAWLLKHWDRRRGLSQT